MNLLQVTATDLVQFLDYNSSVAPLMMKLELFYGMVAPFDILMQNFLIKQECHRAYGTAERDSYVIVMLIPNVANVIVWHTIFM